MPRRKNLTVPTTGKSEGIYLNADVVPEPPIEYVAWVDIMGTRSVLRRSHSMGMNYVMKLHAGALGFYHECEVDLFPVVDGIYACSGHLDNLLRFLKLTMSKLALTFISEKQIQYRFVVRGAIAYGPVIRGTGAARGNRVLEDNPDYLGRILLGAPIIQAYEEERSAAPFGIYVHESARFFAPPGSKALPFTHWQWWTWRNQTQDTELATCLGAKLADYFSWCKAHSSTILYPVEDIRRHEALCHEYFGDVGRGPALAAPDVGQPATA